jgi:dihydroxyacetone kinase
MTLLFNDPASFVEETIEGFVAANRRWVRAVPGGVVRRSPPPDPTVAVVIGGGSGHYPAFSGLVGPGMAHGAVIGNVFASPSAEQVYRVAAGCQSGAGVLLSYGNYAGDVLNFDQAQERLRREGISCRTVVVTDDISSAPLDEAHRRRGIAGDLAVFKIAGAAADEGRSLDVVADLAARANQRCRSLGVAFTGCTLPGASQRLFEVPPGRMGVGMGVHGEPGIREQAMPSAGELARLFVEALLADRPPGIGTVDGKRVVVILNGLGSVKYEELFVVYGRVARELAHAGVNVVDARVGEFVTSFDMAGVSMTLLWLDDDLERLWSAPADSPAFCSVSSAAQVAVELDGESQPAVERPLAASSAESRAAASVLTTALRSISISIDEQAETLGRIDSVAGDGDHGIGMQRGARAAADAAEAAAAGGAGVRTALILAAGAWADRGGGASGALWGVALGALAAELSDEARPALRELAAGVAAAAQAVRASGKAQPGDKTMVDAMQPFASTFQEAVGRGDAVDVAWGAACEAAERGADATASMVARVGRARPHGERSVGTPDPGARSFVVVVRAALPALVKGAPSSWPTGSEKHRA